MERPEEHVLRRMYVEEKKSLTEIGRILGGDASLIRYWMVKYDIPRRSISEGTKLSGKYGVHSEAHRETLRKNLAYGRTKITAESRAKQSKKMAGREPPNKGKPMSETQRQLLIEQRADPEYRRRQGERITGANSPWWKGGVKSESARRLDTAEWRRIRREVYERDNWTCQDCEQRCLNTKDSRSKPKLKIQAHHIVSRRNGGGDELENLVTLCMSCHHKRERKENTK